MKYILVTEEGQSEEVTYCMIPTNDILEKGKTMGKVKRSVVALGSGAGRDEQVEHRVFLRQ